MIASVPATSETIRNSMKELDLDILKRHFQTSVIADDSNENLEEIEPFVVCKGVSVDIFNEYIGDEERLPIAVRFLELDKDGRLLIVEYPNSKVQEATVRVFDRELGLAFGNQRQLGVSGSLTASRARFPGKEPDSAFGPMSDTPNSTTPPHPRSHDDWITLAVEVGITQSWESLVNAACWWYGYEGIQYILLLQVSKRARAMSYRLYDVINNPMLQPQQLPPPVQEGYFRHKQNGAPENITLDNRRILSIPAGLALPPGVNAFAVVNFRDVMAGVIGNLRRP